MPESKLNILALGSILTSFSDVYTVGSNGRAIITSIQLTNLTEGEVTVNARIQRAGTSVWLSPKNFILGAGYKADLLDAQEKLGLKEGDIIQLQAAANNAIDFMVIGEEQIL